jgi:hypothetical protein
MLSAARNFRGSHVVTLNSLGSVFVKLQPQCLHVIHKLVFIMQNKYCLCGLMIRVPGYSSGGPGSIHGATRSSET